MNKIIIKTIHNREEVIAENRMFRTKAELADIFEKYYKCFFEVFNDNNEVVGWGTIGGKNNYFFNSEGEQSTN